MAVSDVATTVVDLSKGQPSTRRRLSYKSNRNKVFSTHMEGGDTNTERTQGQDEFDAALEVESHKYDSEMSLGIGFQESEMRRRRIDEETDNDRCIRKYTMTNILVFLIVVSIYKVFILISFGFYTFKS